MTKQDTMKKEFAKTIKAFRDSDANPARGDYPKAMMTQAQIRNGTSTVNLGYNDRAKARLNALVKDKGFCAYCEKYSIKSPGVEIVKNSTGSMQYNLRLNYSITD